MILNKPTDFLEPAIKRPGSLRYSSSHVDAVNTSGLDITSTGSGKMVRLVKDKEMAEMLETEPEVAEELA